MKKVLLASTALILSAGFAAAEVTVAGDGRMGIIGFDNNTGDDLAFTSRIRISFAASGETDGGLTFGGSVRVDNYEQDQATNGTEGNVFVSGAFGKLSMGDVSGAAEAAVGDLSGVGLTGLGDENELTYLLNTSVAGQRPSARYEYSTGDITAYLSFDNPVGANEGYGVAVKYAPSNYSVSLGYENVDVAGVTFDHVILGGSAVFGGATVKAVYGNADNNVPGLDDDQYGLSLDYVFGATTVTAFGIKQFDGETDYGIGGRYDLGGGAALVGGVVRDNSNSIVFGDETRYDFGMSMTF
ncbi:porin [Oceaniovalibus sp. ACAM 378]|uniref:porin n=1 Tax=Oceaniovalibus sp. ACAM 378 TaxID=2599923 RepID=UPI0011D3439C|nr:porin [Oceaniovalibus sp. ACAM 378]TYB88614.1 porin [Oceaniovalibus sp. ACAM 378]